MASDVLTVKDKVQRYLTDLVGRIEIDSDGDFTFRHGSARMFVSVGAIGKDNTVVALNVPLTLRVRPSAELFHFIATNADRYVFGHLSASERDDGVLVMYSHSLLGDYLDAEELKWAVGAMATTADDLDNEIRDKFGGDLFHED